MLICKKCELPTIVVVTVYEDIYKGRKTLMISHGITRCCDAVVILPTEPAATLCRYDLEINEWTLK